MTALVLQITFDALLLGGLFAIGGLGFALIWGVLNVLNIAFGAFIMIGGYLSFYLWQAGLDPLATIPITMAIMFVMGWLTQRLLIDHVAGGPSSLGVAFTYGLNLALIGLALYLFSADYRSIILPDYLQGYVSLGGAKLTYVRVITAGIALLLTGAMWWAMDRTELGAAIRATRLDREAAQLVGIRVRSVFNITTGIGAALAGAMGALIALVYSASPANGDQYLLQVIIVTVLGGLGSFVGPLLGALLLGLASSIVANLWGTTYAMLIGTLLVLIVLVVRPSGLLGKRYYES
ncbi:branched-chain amino acid ABC transporter permease [Roseomonas chloroacetimidivorans]|uniref:branched-chain amino acid ABC transporter permease n=1 Tax=Roseomonas chloroacetimidivorans TaxID=1766656 RepID=UPI003C77511A